MFRTGTPHPPRGSALGDEGRGGGVARVVDNRGGGMMCTGDLGVCIIAIVVVVVVVVGAEVVVVLLEVVVVVEEVV